MVNRFEELRYEDKLAPSPFITMSQLAKELDISKATVSKLEHEENYDARISIIKKYKERFPEVSYDYLLGATGTKHKQYSRIEEELPFSNEFYDNLKKVVIATEGVNSPFDLNTKEVKRLGVEYILEAILQNPEVLGNVLESIYHALEQIYLITHAHGYYLDDLDLEDAPLIADAMNVSAQHFYINRIISKYLSDYISPLLEGRFERTLKNEAYQNKYKDVEELLPF